MNIHELYNGFRVIITNEEKELLDKIKNSDSYYYKKHLDDRERIIANSLVEKDVLIREIDDEQVYYKINKPESLWRD